MISPGLITIPVAFRNIHRTDGTGRQTEQRIQAQIDTLNAAFGRVARRAAQEGYPSQDIQFRLVALTRVADDTDNDTLISNDACARSPLLDPTRVLNICSEQYSPNGGYASPFSSVVISNIALLPVTPSSQIPQAGGVVVHEVGHYLSLLHTFHGRCKGTTQSTCENYGDEVCDTPPTTGNIWPNVFPGSNSCFDTLGPNGSDLPDDVENFMDYSLDPYWNNFSVGQLLRMRSALFLSAPTIANGNGRAVQFSQSFTVSMNEDVTFYDADFIFAAGTSVVAQGTFNANGANLTAQNPTAGWGGVRYDSQGTSSQSAISRITGTTISAVRYTPPSDPSRFLYPPNAAVAVNDRPVVITNSVISGSRYANGVLASGANASVTVSGLSTTIANNEGLGVVGTGGATVVVEDKASAGSSVVCRLTFRSRLGQTIPHLALG